MGTVCNDCHTSEIMLGATNTMDMHYDKQTETLKQGASDEDDRTWGHSLCGFSNGHLALLAAVRHIVAHERHRCLSCQA